MRKRIVRTAGIARQRLAERMHKRRKTLAEWQQKVVDPSEVAKRMSQIWGISVEGLMPKEGSAELEQNRGGSYSTLTHQFAVKKDLNEETGSGMRAHETMHGLHNVVSGAWPHKRLSLRRRKLVFALGINPPALQREMAMELVADAARKSEDRVMHLEATGNALVGGFAGSWLSAGGAALLALLHPAAFWAEAVFISKIVGRGIEFRAQRGSIQRLYGKHGIDGLIMFMAAPPKVFGAIEMRLWERKMVKQGILEMSGGLTTKGVKFLREHLPREKIIGRLSDMAAMRRLMESIDWLKQRASK